MTPLDQYVDESLFGDAKKKAREIASKLAEKLRKGDLSKEESAKLADYLTSGQFSDDIFIDTFKSYL